MIRRLAHCNSSNYSTKRIEPFNLQIYSNEYTGIARKKEKMSKNTFEKYKGNISIFLETIMNDLPEYIVPVEKKGCKLLRSTELTEKDISEKVRYLQFFQNCDINLAGVRIAVVDDATKYTSMLFKYRKYFENKGAIVSTYSFVGQAKLLSSEREQYDSKAKIFKYLEESAYQEYITQQSQFLSTEDNIFDIDHIVMNFHITNERYESLVSQFSLIGNIEFSNDVYTPKNIEKISLFNFKLVSAESYFSNGVTSGSLQKIRFAYNRKTEKLAVAPILFPIWDSKITKTDEIFKNIPFELPYNIIEELTNEGIYFNICFAFHLVLLKSFLELMTAFPEVNCFALETQDITAYAGAQRAEKMIPSVKKFLADGQLPCQHFPLRNIIALPHKKKSVFYSVMEVMDELRGEYEGLVNNSKSLLDVRYFLSYEEIISRYHGRANIMKWIDILCDRGVLVARNCESQGIYYRACRSGEGNYNQIEEKSLSLLPVAINACGYLVKSELGAFFRINAMFLNKVLANLVYDYPKEEYDFHAYFTKPYFFGPLTYLKDQLDDEVDIPIYNAEKISKYCTFDERNKEFVSINIKRVRNKVSEFFGQDNAVPYTEITSYLGFLKVIREQKGSDDFLNSIAICRDEVVYYRHIYFNINTAYQDINIAYNGYIEYRKEQFLRDSAINLNSAETKLKYNQNEIIEYLSEIDNFDLVFDKAQEKISKSFVPFSNNFEEKLLPVLKKVVLLEYLITNLLLFDVTSEFKYFRKFISKCNKEKYYDFINFDYFNKSEECEKEMWSDDIQHNEFKKEIYRATDCLISALRNNFKLLPSPSNKNYMQDQRRRNKTYTINRAARYISNNSLSSATILYYSFAGYRNLENKKSINVIALVQEQVAVILAKEMNGVIIFGATGSEELGILVFSSFQDALNFSCELNSIFSSHKIWNQIHFRYGCSFRKIDESDINGQIESALRDAADCLVIEPKCINQSRFTISLETRDMLAKSFIPSDFTKIQYSSQAVTEKSYFEFDRIKTQDDQVVKYESYVDENVRIGIVTVLLDEHTAMKEMLTNVRTAIFPSNGAGHQFILGNIKAFGDGEHTVALARTLGDGNNKAALRASKLIEHFPKLKVILMVGIAGGTPLIIENCPANDSEIIERHVRLGDIVLSSGIIQYDYIKQKYNETKLKGDNIPPCAILVQAKNTLDESSTTGIRIWERYISNAIDHLADSFSRPDTLTDILYDYDGNIISHPVDDNRVLNPYVFSGKIASANTVMKTPQMRDKLKLEHDVYAIEMEASGIADATWEAGIGYYVVRGICDYCDSHKNGKWHKYASLVAAAYARSLIEKMPFDN